MFRIFKIYLNVTGLSDNLYVSSIFLVNKMDTLSQQLAGHIPYILSIRTKLSDPFPT